MSNDERFVSELIEGFQKFDTIINEWCVLIRDLNLNVIYSSPQYNRAFKINEPIIGKPAFIITNNEDFNFQQKIDIDKIIKNRVRVSNFVIADFEGRNQPFSLDKSPLINPETDNVVGIFCFYKPLFFISIPIQILRAHKFYEYTHDTDISQFNLTGREKEAIFLFLAGLPSEEIANVLSLVGGKKITKTTVDAIFRNQLFLKFNVYNRKSLYRKLLSLSLDNYIPFSLLTCVEQPIARLTAY